MSDVGSSPTRHTLKVVWFGEVNGFSEPPLEASFLRFMGQLFGSLFTSIKKIVECVKKNESRDLYRTEGNRDDKFATITIAITAPIGVDAVFVANTTNRLTKAVSNKIRLFYCIGLWCSGSMKDFV